MKQHGYLVTMQAFIPSSKTDFKEQAAAATLMAGLTETKALTPEFLAQAQVIDVAAKPGSHGEAGDAA